jgi:hypothetical protein
MATFFWVRFKTSKNNNDGETRRSECQNCVDILLRIATMLQNTHASGTVLDRNGLAHSYTYTPTAGA